MRWHKSWRRFHIPARRAYPSRGEGVFASAVIGIGLALLLIWRINLQIRPIFSSLARIKVENTVTGVLEKTINDYISEQNISYQDVITLEKDSNGVITALTSNMSRLNGLRNGILISVTDAVDTIDTEEISIPVGNLTGITLLSGAGFHLPVRAISVGTAKAVFQHAFSAAGINQTHHQIMLDVTVKLNILLPGETVTTEVSTQVCAAETIIVGSVPETYLQMQQQ